MTWPPLHLRKIRRHEMTPSKLPRRIRPRWRRERQPGLSTNRNSASRVAGPATQLRSTANQNSAHPSSSTVTRPRSAANENSPLPGQRPGTSRSNMSAPVEHHQTFLRPQNPRSSTNENAGRRFDADHPEIRGVYKPAQHSIQQDYHTSNRRDSFSGSGLSSPALHRSHRDSFSESPSGQLNKKSVTDSKREVRIARGQRPGIVYPLPRAAHPDTQLPYLKLLPYAMWNGLLPLWTSRSRESWRKLAAQNRLTGVDCTRSGAIHANGKGIAPLEYLGQRSAPHTTATGVNSLLLPGINKESPMTWYKQRNVDDLV